ncbi:IclR family transcriptional regulator [Streptomyces sp. B-S-A8]|uniref:IclR family transcriptional regulator n=1 Tax=Streptomyces solicavernae TaxID=3043614 RepID=A0ABT6RZG8_9ACTN|nr:IclR family transcriptional regulator [Streptomyces sp. B-S-A8]MDI3389836.1 IclR family transcriptional regulator [Streptomyces sp. B-S-A8]
MTVEGSTGLHRTVAILTVLGTGEAAEQGGLGVVEIARRVGKEKTQVSRALKSMEQTGLVERDPHSLVYRLGWRMFTLAANAGRPRLLAEGPAVLKRLVGVLKERVHVTVLCGEGVLTVLSESPMRAIQATGWVGRVTPLHSTSSGRALLFDHSPDEIRLLCAGLSFGPGSYGADAPGASRAPRDADDLIARVGQARKTGYALVDEEFEAGLVAAAAPVRDFRGRVIAAVNVSAPAHRMSRDLDRAGRLTQAAADQLSRAMAGIGSTNGTRPPAACATPSPVRT